MRNVPIIEGPCAEQNLSPVTNKQAAGSPGDCLGSFHERTMRSLILYKRTQLLRFQSPYPAPLQEEFAMRSGNGKSSGPSRQTNKCNETPQDATQNGKCSLSPAQLKALSVLAAGQSISDAARAAEVDRGTVHRWLIHDSVFAAEFNAARLEMVERVRAGVRQLADEAITTLRELMGPSTPANVRLRVVELVLAHAARGAEDDRIGPPLPDQVEAEKEQPT